MIFMAHFNDKTIISLGKKENKWYYYSKIAQKQFFFCMRCSSDVPSLCCAVSSSSVIAEAKEKEVKSVI